MDQLNYISIQKIILHYPIEDSFVWELHYNKMITIISINKEHFIHENDLNKLEKIIRIYLDLDINIEGIDVVFNLLKEIEELKEKLKKLENKLTIFDVKEQSHLN